MEDGNCNGWSSTRRSAAPGLCDNFLSYPSSGMENSLYRGECILVNKWSYGLRLPFTKLWGYHRWADSPVQKEDNSCIQQSCQSFRTRDWPTGSLYQPLHRYSRRYLADRFAFFSDSFRKECTRPEVPLFLPQATGTTVGFIAFHPFHRSQQTIGAGLNKEYTQFQPLWTLLAGTSHERELLDRTDCQGRLHGDAETSDNPQQRQSQYAYIRGTRLCCEIPWYFTKRNRPKSRTTPFMWKASPCSTAILPKTTTG